MIYTDKDNITLHSFLTVCKEHKDRCHGDCNVSMYMLGRLYMNLVGRELTEEERKLFM